MPRDQMANPGFVYFIRAGRTNAVKIGWAVDPHKRLEALQTGSPHRLYLVAYTPGSHADEQDWHERYRAARIRGEWFTLTGDLRHEINRLHVIVEGAVSYLHLSILTRGARQ